MMAIPQHEVPFFGEGDGGGGEATRTDQHAPCPGLILRQGSVERPRDLDPDRRRMVLALEVERHAHTNLVYAPCDEVDASIPRYRGGVYAPPLPLQQPLDVELELHPAKL